MSKVQKLTEAESKWQTDKGAWIPGKTVIYRGKDLFNDFRDRSWIFLMMYGCTGRVPSDKTAQLMECIWKTSTSFPDPRLWNNRIAALAGTARSTATLGVAAATSTSEAEMIGGRAIYRAIAFLKETQVKFESGKELLPILKSCLSKYRAIPGFGRPLVKNDERITTVIELANELNLGDGKHLQLVWKIQDALAEGRWRLNANMAAVYAALMADLGYSERECYYLALLIFSCGIIPCYIDGIEHEEGMFFPYRCSAINYTGPKGRSWSGGEKNEN